MWEFDWQFWAHRLTGLTASEGLVVREVAFFSGLARRCSGLEQFFSSLDWAKLA